MYKINLQYTILKDFLPALKIYLLSLPLENTPTMIQSMTGFGKSTLQLENKKITLEIKSLNSKAIDLNVRIPQAYREKEFPIAWRGVKLILPSQWRIPLSQVLP